MCVCVCVDRTVDNSLNGTDGSVYTNAFIVDIYTRNPNPYLSTSNNGIRLILWLFGVMVVVRNNKTISFRIKSEPVWTRMQRQQTTTMIIDWYGRKLLEKIHSHFKDAVMSTTSRNCLDYTGSGCGANANEMEQKELICESWSQLKNNKRWSLTKEFHLVWNSMPQVRTHHTLAIINCYSNFVKLEPNQSKTQQIVSCGSTNTHWNTIKYKYHTWTGRQPCREELIYGISGLCISDNWRNIIGKLTMSNMQHIGWIGGRTKEANKTNRK